MHYNYTVLVVFDGERNKMLKQHEAVKVPPQKMPLIIMVSKF